MSVIGELVQRDGVICAACGEQGSLLTRGHLGLVPVLRDPAGPTSTTNQVLVHLGCVGKPVAVAS